MRKLTISSLLLVVSGLALAQEEAPAFDDLDANRDGQISQEEAAKLEGFDFASADKDKNGALSREEYEAAQDA